MAKVEREQYKVQRITEEEYTHKLNESEDYYKQLYQQAIQGLLKIQECRAEIEKRKQSDVVSYWMDTETNQIYISSKPRPKMGFMPWNENEKNNQLE